MVEPPPARISHERIALESLRATLDGISGIEVFSGLGAGNRFGPLLHPRYGRDPRARIGDPLS
jgi:hypothetical protein